ncbi:hypothetical protein ABXN37_08450 [Piscinibacter sakaiensis]|uniref:hypothetical protein n=1 Tax=Piscinibacter sakaiensis TaxID=1547922 RepID=UPI00372A6C85
MPTADDFDSWLAALRLLHPPRHLAHVGAGSGESVVPYARWELPAVTAIEAQPDRLAALRSRAAGRAGWRVLEQVVAPAAGPAEFCTASQPEESGLLDAASLGLWRNLKRRASWPAPR